MADAKGIGAPQTYKLELLARGTVREIADVEDAIREHLQSLPGVSVERWSAYAPTGKRAKGAKP